MTFDLDANGILNVTAEDKASGNRKNITIKNDKGRLSEAEIKRMVEEAERQKDADDLFRKRLDARNHFEGYAYSLRNSLREEQLANKLAQADKAQLEQAIEEATKWLDAHPQAEESEYKDQQSKLEGLANPILTRAYQGGGGGAGAESMGAGGMPGAGRAGAGAAAGGPAGGAGRAQGPTVEEVD